MCAMKTIVCIVVASVFVNTVMMVEQKQVNIALETVMKFGGKRDQSSGLEVIDKVQNALEKIKEGIEIRNGRRSIGRDITFTDFVSQAAKILKTYSDNDLEDVFAVFGDETRRYINRNGELHELFGSGNMRRHLSQQLEDFKEMQADILREHLNAAIIAVENKKYNGEKNDLLDIGDYVYIGGHNTLRAVLRDLEKLGRSTDGHLEDVLRHTLRSLIFDHFSKLNDNIKRELIDTAKDYWRISSGKRGKNKKTCSTTFTPLEEDEYTSNNDKHFYRNRQSFNAQKRQDISDVRPIQRTIKTYNASQHVNKRYKYKNRIQKDREAVTAFTKLYKYKDVTRLTLSDENTNPPFEPESYNKTTVEDVEETKSSKVSRKHVKRNKFTPSFTQTKRPNYSKEDSDKPKDSPYSDLMLLTGGQNAHKVDLRGKSSGETDEDYEEPDRTKEEQASNVTVAASHHPTAKYLSVERFLTKKKIHIPKTKEDNDDKRIVSATVANISVEGLSIESHENDYDYATDYKLENNHKAENDGELENDRKLENDSKLKNYSKFKNNHEVTNNRELTNNHELQNERKLKNNNDYENDHVLDNYHKFKNDRKLANKVIRKYIKNDQLSIENDSELKNYRGLKNANFHVKYNNQKNEKAERILSVTVANESSEGVSIENYVRYQDELENNHKRENTGKLKNDGEVANDRELENDRQIKNNRQRKSDTSQIDHSDAENDRKVTTDHGIENDPKLKNVSKLENKVIINDKLQIQNLDAENDRIRTNDRKLEKKITRKNIINDTLKTDNSEAKNSYILTIDRKLENKVPRKYISNNTLQIKNSEAENDRILTNDGENKVIRKFMQNDTLRIDNSKEPTNVKYMIKNLEMQIEDVREQVDYVKNLTIVDGDSNKQTLRANNGGMFSLRSSSKTKSKHHYLDSESLEKNNRAFFSRDSSESGSSIEITKKSSLAFRANYAKNYTAGNGTVTKIDNNKTTKSVTVYNASNTANRDRLSKINFLLSKIKENVSDEDSFEEAHKTVLNDASKSELNKNITQDIKTITVNMKLNEIDTTTENTTVVKKGIRGMYERSR